MLRDPTVGGPRPLFRSLGIASSGLGAQRARIDVIATNLANADTTRTAEGGPYRRRVVTMEEGLPGAPWTIGAQGYAAGGPPQVAQVPRVGAVPYPGTIDGNGVRVTGVEEAQGEGPMVYDPGHPDADPNGYVQLPNVNTSEELVDLLSSRRLFEANASVFQAVKSILRRSAQL
jgi:flagellar basal-body rod protein FlgC